LKFTDEAEAIAYLYRLSPPILVRVYDAAGACSYSAISESTAHARYVIEQTLGPGAPSGYAIDLENG
jgi:hypothetical protein